MMETALAAARGVHIAAALLLFGELQFACAIAGERWRTIVEATPERGGSLGPHVVTVVGGSLLAGAASAVLWLMIETANMTGLAIEGALRPGTVATVLGETEFGRVWLLRAIVLALLTLAWIALATARDGASQTRRACVASVLAAVFAASLAWTGHAAAATRGTLRAIHLASDAAHALAAGAWLGALPALAMCLRSAQHAAAVSTLTRRFSILGIASVTVLLASGIVNACFLVGSVPALIGTPYGRALGAKIALFAALVAIAAVNRQRLTPRLADGDAGARALLRRNALREVIVGVAIVAIVGVLGTMVPGAHESPVWPFAFTLDFSTDMLDARRWHVLAASAGIALAGIVLIIAGMRRRATWSWIAGSIAVLACAIASLSAFAAPAFPTTYATSPVPYAVPAVARGAARFAQECASCHGAQARGDGPAAKSLAKPPANLALHGAHHPPGNLYWWIAKGIAGSPMPAFAPRLSDVELWELVEYLVARSAAEASAAIDARIAPTGVRVPDFTYEVPQQGQQTLLAQRAPALIVLYSLPRSEPRLMALESDHALMHDGLRIIAVPLAAAGAASAGLPMQPIVDPAVGHIYAMFAGMRDGSTPLHAELLIDADGRLRARWLGLPGDDGKRNAEIADAAKRLPKSAAKAPSGPMHHGH